MVARNSSASSRRTRQRGRLLNGLGHYVVGRHRTRRGQTVQPQTPPWSYDISTTLPALVGNVVAQGDSSSIGCRIVVDGEVKSEKTVHETNAFTFCLLKAA